jgi:DHA1 family inner membrane transport protein
MTGSDSSRRMVSLTLLVLFLGTFTLGSAELLVVGVLDLIARDLHTSVSAAGTLVTAYALGLSIGGPLLTAVTIRAPRRTLLLIALAVYIAGTALAAIATDLTVLLVARALTGTLQGLFVGVAFTIATSVVPPQRIGQAISAVVGGFAVSTAIGVPLGTLLADHIGWRGGFVADIAVGLLVLTASLIVVPRVANPAGGGTAQLRHAVAPRVLAVLGVALVLFAGQYAALTYITPFLQQKTGISGSVISVFLLAYGAATAVGALGGGRFADRNPSRTVVVCGLVLVAAFGALQAAGTSAPLVALILVVWGLAGFGAVPSLQYRVIALAGPGGGLAASLPASAINAGIALGSLTGGWMLTSHGPSGPVVLAMIVCAVAVPLAAATARLTPLVLPPGPTRHSRPASGQPRRNRVHGWRPVRRQEGRRSAVGRVQVAAGSDLGVAEEQDPADRDDEDPYRVAVDPAPVVKPVQDRGD